MDHRPSRVRSSHEGYPERMKIYKERRAKTVHYNIYKLIIYKLIQTDVMISVFQLHVYAPHAQDENIKYIYFYR